eukprot:TRINITY_DN23054_c0_g1_i1.p1 TRINITY_DN23054_c0_g1~~TRINITY_DN23054_c0_g1_i1.p1  ORF type:complete len:190 (+),score=35.83 TRINITY_DN23054_c0_g1_i1:117-686(+)
MKGDYCEFREKLEELPPEENDESGNHGELTRDPRGPPKNAGTACGSANRTASKRRRCAHRLERAADYIFEVKNTAAALVEQGADGFKKVLTMLMAFVPMLLGAMRVLTAVVLLSDVLFKIIATVVTETADYLLHRRVKQRVQAGLNFSLGGVVIGSPLCGDDEDPKKQAQAGHSALAWEKPTKNKVDSE